MRPFPQGGTPPPISVACGYFSTGRVGDGPPTDGPPAGAAGTAAAALAWPSAPAPIGPASGASAVTLDSKPFD